MKLRLLERNYWGDHDTWKGRMKHYKVEIETPFRKNVDHYGKYSFSIKKPDGTIYNTNMSKLYFNSLNECYDYVVNWINEDINKNIT